MYRHPLRPGTAHVRNPGSSVLIAATVPGAVDGTLGSHGLAPDVSLGAGLLIEVILTFILVFVVFSTAMDPRGMAHLAPVAIGLAIMVDHLMGVPLTGAYMNPARSFGPALVGGTWDNHWILGAGPMVGGVLAAVLYDQIFLKRRSEEHPAQQ